MKWTRVLLEEPLRVEGYGRRSLVVRAFQAQPHYVLRIQLHFSLLGNTSTRVQDWLAQRTRQTRLRDYFIPIMEHVPVPSSSLEQLTWESHDDEREFKRWQKQAAPVRDQMELTVMPMTRYGTMSDVLDTKKLDMRILQRLLFHVLHAFALLHTEFNWMRFRHNDLIVNNMGVTVGDHNQPVTYKVGTQTYRFAHDHYQPVFLDFDLATTVAQGNKRKERETHDLYYDIHTLFNSMYNRLRRRYTWNDLPAQLRALFDRILPPAVRVTERQKARFYVEEQRAKGNLEGVKFYQKYQTQSIAVEILGHDDVLSSWFGSFAAEDKASM